MHAPVPGPPVRAADGVSLATWDLGGDGPPLLLLHPTGFHGRCWAPLAGELGGRFHCWALDQRGHGGSQRAADYAWRRFSEDARAAVAVLGLERPFVAGHSLGGGIALMAEAQWPGTFEAIFAFEPIVITASPAGHSDGEGGRGARENGTGDNGNLMAHVARRRRPSFPSRAAALDNYARKPPFASFRADVLSAYVDGGFTDTAEGAVTLSCDPESEALVFEAARHAAIADLLRPSATPTYLACGSEDPVIGPRQLDEIAQRLGGASCLLFDSLGHLGPFENPRWLAAAIAQAFS